MRGFLAFLVVGASVAWLIPWPMLWPATLAAIAVAWLVLPESNPRPDGGKRSREREA